MACVAVICGIFATVSPMWLISRTELHNKLCWKGSGLFQVDFVWGQDIDEIPLKCTGTSKSSYDEYCKVDDPTDYQKVMCAHTNWAKVAGVSAQVVGLGALVLAYDVGNKRHWPVNGYTNEAKITKLLLGVSILSAVLSTLAFFIMYTSPLFSAEHAKEMSKDQAVPFPSAQFGCYFQSPLRAKNMLEALTHSSPLACLFGGPSFAMSACSYVCWYLACVFYALVVHDVTRLNLAFAIDPNLAARVTPKPPIRHPLLEEILYPRHYSLYGAMHRHFGVRTFWTRVVVMALPLATMLTAAVFSIMMLLNGAAVQVFVRISSPAFHFPEWQTILEKYPAHRVVFEDGTLLQEHLQAALSSAHRNGPAVIEIIEEVFDFTMLTSIKNFWDGKAYALALLTAVFCAVWPYVRVTLHLFAFFIPLSEHHRGRLVTWLDGLGKWTMVNTFVLCFMGVAFHLNSTIRVAGLLPTSKDLLDVGVEVTLGPRAATYMFVVGVLLSLVVSEFYVWIHRQCRDWEEDRNAMKRAAGYESLQASEVVGGIAAVPDDAAAATASSNLINESSFLQHGYTPSAFEVPNGGILQNLPGQPARSRHIVYAHGFGYEALCDRHHNPIPGKKYVYSSLAKALIWICLGLTACTTLAGMLQVSMSFTFAGFVGAVIVDDHDRCREYSLMSIGTSIETNMGSVKAGGIFLTGVFFLVSFVCPLLRICGLSVLWFVPMRPQQQKFWFHLMEVIDSWSALDVYFVSTLAATLEISAMSQVILGHSFPAVELLVDQVLPRYGGLFVINEKLLNGMFLIMTGVVFEKFMSLIIVAQTAQSVAERIAEETLALDRNRGLPGIREENDMFHELEAHPETWAILSPAARYTSASGLPNIVYSGLPRFVWLAGIRLGLMVEIEFESGNDSGGREPADAQASYFSLEGA